MLYLIDRGDILENLRVKGTVRIYNEDKTELLSEYENAYLDNGKNAFMKFLKGEFYIEGYKYLAIGTDSTETKGDMTNLQDEQFRKEFSTVQVDGTKLILDTMIEAEEANFDGTWGELGLVVGGNASTINSGEVFNRVVIQEKKTEKTAITVSWTIEVLST